MQELDAPYHEGKFTAKFESFNAQTKTSIHIDNKLAWSEGDQIAIFQGTATGMKYQIVDSSVGTDQATFTFVGENSGDNDFTSGTVVDANIAVYPYSDDLTFTVDDADGVVYTINNIEIPSVQEYAGASFANGAFPMVAVTSSLSEKNLIFKNLIGVLKLSLKGPYKVMGVEIEGNDGEDLAGRLSVTAYSDNGAPSMMFKDNTSKKIVLDCGDGVQLYEDYATDFYIALSPVRFEKGFKVTITDSDYQKYSVETQKLNTVFRSSILTMPGVESDQYQHEGIDVYLDEYGINHGPGIEIDGVIWAPVNCGYHETNYPYGKLYQWGRKYGQKHTNGGYVSPLPSFYDGQKAENENNYYHTGNISLSNWFNGSYYNLWNNGTEDSPVKMTFDPCPEGWRVPTKSEFKILSEGNISSWTQNEANLYGKWFYGNSSSSGIFLPAAGCNEIYPLYELPGDSGIYWTSTPNSPYSEAFKFYEDSSSMFWFGLDRVMGGSVRCVKNDNPNVRKVEFNRKEVVMSVGTTKVLDVTLYPVTAIDKTLTWSSSNPSIVSVSQEGEVVAHTEGRAIITAIANNGVAGSCGVNVGTVGLDYIDEYGVNHGPGVKIGDVIWAPVNCGYKKPSFAKKGYSFGKLYQWGRKYGHGYGESDESVPHLSDPIDVENGLSETFANFFFRGYYPDYYDWATSQVDDLWNNGTEEYPQKTDNDPCPTGWRVPTSTELRALTRHFSSWVEEDDGENGFWFSGDKEYSVDVPQIYLPATGFRYHVGTVNWRTKGGAYWSSSPTDGGADALVFYYNGNKSVGIDYRSQGYAVRCVQE